MIIEMKRQDLGEEVERHPLPPRCDDLAFRPQRLEAFYYPQATQRVMERKKYFDASWEESEAVIELAGMKL